MATQFLLSIPNAIFSIHRRRSKDKIQNASNEKLRCEWRNNQGLSDPILMIPTSPPKLATMFSETEAFFNEKSHANP